jgi:lipopolysaccharide transport system ATP-binding protein
MTNMHDVVPGAKAEPVIRIEGVSKLYPVFANPWQGMRYLARAVRYGRADPRDIANSVPALQDINLTVSHGERVGIIGRNGAGKSTLLKLLAGTFPPTTGTLHVDGEIYSLLPGSVSLSQELSTLENARQHLTMLSLSVADFDKAIAEIRDFTELGEYFTQPTKNLSLGMRVRAEFAIATARMADIVIIDEVLGAGDIYWSEKIARRMERLCARGTTLLLVSHSLSQITRYCERAIWIEHGQTVLDGEAIEVTKRYEGFLERLSWHTDDLDDKTVSVGESAAVLGDELLADSGQTVTRWPGRGDVKVSGVWINGEAVTRLTVAHGQPLVFRFTLRAERTGDYRLRYLFTFWDTLGRRVAVLENDVDAVRVEYGSAHKVEVTCPQFAVVYGSYHITLTVSDTEQAARTTTEGVIRLDALYKSFHLDVIDPAPASRPEQRPVYRIHTIQETT